jgi:hypothetical protein
MNATDKLELQLEEGDDGSVRVQLPNHHGSDNEPDNPPNRKESAPDDDDDDDEPRGSSNPQDGDREEIRAARREERKLKKQLHREKARESNVLISALRKNNEEMARKVAELERRTSHAEIARIDNALNDAMVQAEWAEVRIKDSVTAQDGDSMIKAQRDLMEAQRKINEISGLKQQHQTQLQNIKQVAPVQDMPDPSVQRMAAQWMSRTSWFNPNGGDIDSDLAKKIDKKVMEEGFDPTTEDYWEELDDRLSKYLPHHYNQGNNQMNNQSNDRSQKERPRSFVTGSSREGTSNGKSGDYYVKPERVAAMKEAGIWDNNEARNRMIKKFADWDRQNKNRG